MARLISRNRGALKKLKTEIPFVIMPIYKNPPQKIMKSRKNGI